MKTMHNSKENVYDVLKTVTTVFVVLGHVTIMWTDDGVFTPASSSFVLANVSNFLYSFHMPLFFFVSGAVYRMCIRRKGGYHKGVELMKRKARRLLVPYFLAGFFYVAPCMELMHLTSDGYFRFLVQGIILARNCRHLWYLLALFWIFVFFAIVSMIPSLYGKIEKGEGKCEDMALIGLVLFLMILGTFAFHMSNRTFQVKTAIYHSQYFAMGMLAQKYEAPLAAFAKKHIWTWIVSGILVFVLLPFDIYPLHVQRAVLGMYFLYGTCLQLLESKRFLASSPYRAIHRRSMPIYLIHPMINYLIFYLLGQRIKSPALMAILAFTISLIASERLASCGGTHEHGKMG